MWDVFPLARLMDNPLQLVAWLALVAVAVVSSQLVLNQYRLYRTARETTALEFQFLRERIALIADQRRIEREKSESSWNGFRKFRIADKVMETEDICSFYLAPHDGKPLPPFLPGQYLTFQVKLPGQLKPVVRCYSLSERPGLPDRYRVTIKRVPSGLVSNHFHDRLRVGDIVDVKAPAGQFVLDLQRPTPIALIGGGVGVTPMLSMFNAVAEGGARRDVWFFYGVRHGREHIMKDALRSVATRNPSLRLHVCYSDPSEADRSASSPAFEHAERISVDLLKRVLPSNQLEFYLCGPPPLMSSLTQGLKDWGVPEDHVFFEAFGPATVGLKVEFGRAGKSLAWSPDAGCLLDFARQNGVQIDAGCRAGNCGTCLVAIKSGEVNYLREPGVTVETGSCLTCISVPKTALVLDA
jgi:ferredoxin-NADP reductase